MANSQISFILLGLLAAAAARPSRALLINGTIAQVDNLYNRVGEGIHDDLFAILKQCTMIRHGSAADSQISLLFLFAWLPKFS